MADRQLAEGMRVSIDFVLDEARVASFAETTGDDAPHHLDADFASGSALGGRVAHGALLIGFVSAASTQVLRGVAGHYVSTGFERIRFRAPVVFDDGARVTVAYEISVVDDATGNVEAVFEVRRDDGVVCCNGIHLMKRIGEK